MLTRMHRCFHNPNTMFFPADNLWIREMWFKQFRYIREEHLITIVWNQHLLLRDQSPIEFRWISIKTRIFIDIGDAIRSRARGIILLIRGLADTPLAVEEFPNDVGMHVDIGAVPNQLLLTDDRTWRFVIIMPLAVITVIVLGRHIGRIIGVDGSRQ